ncbi:DegT/DnrJ/EryC1/StrS family aminotransferase [Methylobacterium sp. J-026]|uniref:DegT/DnrJ/EryC1/StrS family aminotransferase n=1 Tax=Methylobacterium sp. J-026 TaxID=2836624 RepID=UPI001FBA585C|nr:DegT/DnrJ/EryC1/StrS family aminotransferase [Methylobacterium sp. J-026]MCJ2134963.1 DegT/DnrJ/EryC1/StrS family aminotransferase [Methylobacterium sp. J-026]
MSQSQPIPQTDPRAGYLRRKAEIDAAVTRVLSGGQYILGSEMEAFEAEFAAWTEAEQAIAVGNGTDGLVIGLLALGVQPGDRVITVSHTAVATVSAIEMIGAVPVLVDTDACYGMDPSGLSHVLDACLREGRRVGAVIPVHLYGQAADLEPICATAARAAVPVLEDCSQAHGATLGGRQVGRYGQAAVYSFYPTKNLGGYGDGGMITTDVAALADECRACRQYGWRERFVSASAGRNSRLDEMQAAILRVKLASLSEDNARRGAIAALYDQGLATAPIERPQRRAQAGHVFHQYVIRAEGRDDLKARLAERGIGTGLHYPVPVHLQPAYAGRIALADGELPNTEASARVILSLPMYPELTDTDVERVIAAISASMS